ncbi:DUF4233 domain-containing protein [Actinocorallia longicatena]|uniref:DUF4233 domain-containing protein n=1 Tax=Actinocorallia longicatena TaxID=111803 RepID=A0ABP6QKB5_9ACTN
MRRLCAMILTCEAIIIALAIPVAIAVGHTGGALAGGVGGALAVISLLLAGTLGRPWGLHAATAFQVLILLTGFVVPTMFILGVLFGALWGYALWLGKNVENAQPR